jgi:hypothetical protein
MLALLLALLMPAAAEPTRGAAPLVAAQADGALYDNVRLIVVGIDDYESLPPYSQLTYAVGDAQAVRDALVEQFQVDEIAELFNEQATKRGILDELRRARTLGKNDALLIFWAGHGLSEAGPRGDLVGYLVPHDGSLESDKMMANLPMSDLRSTITEQVGAKHVFLIVDACYGGILAKRDAAVAEVDPTDAYLRSVTSESVFQVLTAGQHGETVLDGGPNGHSVFADELIRTLGQSKGHLSANMLAPAISGSVFSAAHRRGHKQTPDFGRVFGSGDFVLVPRAPAVPSAPPTGAAAVRYHQDRCDGGNGADCFELAGMYDAGRFVPRSGFEAAERFLLACKHGVETGCLEAGVSGPSFELIVEGGPAEGVYEMNGSTWNIGRAPDNDLVLEGREVSRYHSRLYRRGNALFIEDNRSSNGTTVDGETVTVKQLRGGEVIVIGSTRLMLGTGE